MLQVHLKHFHYYVLNRWWTEQLCHKSLGSKSRALIYTQYDSVLSWNTTWKMFFSAKILNCFYLNALGFVFFVVTVCPTCPSV